MKTKLTTIIGLVALGMIALTNINATAATIGMNNLVAVESEKNIGVEAWMMDSNLWMENSGCKAENAEKTERTERTEKAEREKATEVEAWMTEEEFFKAAESYTAASSAKEIEKYANKQITALKHERENK